MINYEYALMQVGVPKDKVDSCMAWAFGVGWGAMVVSTSDDVWNKRHGDLFILLGSDDVIEGLERIGRAYVKEVQNDARRDEG